MAALTVLFFSAIGLLLVIEGIMPFIAPRVWKRMMMSAALQPEKSIRIFGLALMLVGLIILYILHH